MKPIHVMAASVLILFVCNLLSFWNWHTAVADRDQATSLLIEAEGLLNNCYGHPNKSRGKSVDEPKT